MADTQTTLAAVLADRYAVERELGRGGMATVYLARDRGDGTLVAVKVLHPELAASLGSDRFLREIALGDTLQHPNIMPVLVSGKADGLLYYVMPFIEGESLRDRLDREKQLAIPEVLDITRQVADALTYAHSKGVIHRDVKPENIMLAGERAIVADFGIARAVSVAGGEKLTQTGMAVGTPTYMSPEQAVGSRDVTPQSDVYSLGCVVYEMLSGEPPFTGSTAAAILARHSLEKARSLRIVRGTVPEEVEDAILCALEKVPADRFRTPSAFAAALTDPKLTPTRRRPSGQTQKPKSRVALWSGIAAAVLVGAAGLGWLTFKGAGGDDATPGLDPRHVAVLYFEDRTAGADLRHVADGFTEALIDEMSRVQPLRVISRNGVRPYSGSGVTTDSIARALKVGTLVEGTVAQSGDRLRVMVALINANTGAQIGSKTLERGREEIFALQDDVAKEVSLFLRERLGEEVRLQERRATTRSAAAWEALQQADRVLLDADPLLAAGDMEAASRKLKEADSAYARAESLDPKWSAPVAARGWTAYRQSRLPGTFQKSWNDDWTKRGLEHAERALALDRNDADALDLRGTLRYWRWLLNLAPSGAEADALFADAEADLRASVAANPIQATAWNSLSHLLFAKGQTAEGKVSALRAYEADPYLSDAGRTVWRLFQGSLDLADQAEATRWCAEGTRRFPEDPRFAECHIWLYSLPGQQPDIAKAWGLLDEYLKLSPPNARDFRRLRGQMIVAMALARAGLADSAKAVAERSRADASADPTRELAFLEAIVRTMLDDKDEAIRLLNTFAATNPQQSAQKDETWWFSALKDDPRYKALAGS